MNNSKILIFLFSFLLITSCASLKKSIPLVNAHAHNDYEHTRPLFDALDNGFNSVEADIYLINNNLYVSHFAPSTIDSTKTLEALYLKPLSNRIKQNKGNVYQGYKGFFYLMIDIKTEATPSYDKLKEVLKNYESMISKVNVGKEEQNKPIKIVITGMKGRPFNQILADEPKYCSIDGKINELERGISAAVMPYISEKYTDFLSYKGVGIPSSKDINTIQEMVSKTHKENKKLRFWASPDNQKVWEFLLDNEVDLVNTDSLFQFKSFMLKRKH